MAFVVAVVVSLFATTTILTPTIHAQAQCDPDYTSVTEQFRFRYQGICCTVTFKACIKAGEIVFQGAFADPDCPWQFDQFFPENTLKDIIHRGFEIVLVRHINLITGGMDLEPCPTYTTWSVKTVVATCATRITYQILVPGPGGTETWKTVTEVMPCGTTKCEQTCAACISQNTDDCENLEPRVYWDCENQPSPPNCQVPCPIGICADLRPYIP